MPQTGCPERGVLHVADSFLVVDGAVPGLELHRRRFLDATGLSPAQWDAVLTGVPRAGAWFPRVEKRVGADEPSLLLRAAPARTPTVVVRAAAHDPRRVPLIKGPDLGALDELRGTAHAHGAGEAVILSNGCIVEGAGSSLIWWRDDELRTVAPEFPRLPGVTERLVLDLASRSGIGVAAERATPRDLVGCELWVLSSLHGIRAVTGWVDGPELADPDLARLERWRAAWAGLAQPIGRPTDDAATGRDGRR